MLGQMKLHPRVTRTGVELVKRFEGLRRRAARLPDGGWTIGYGHTLTAREGAEVSPEDAEALLYYDLSDVAGKLEAWTFTPLNQNQFEALSAFTFNIGLENFRNSTVLKRVNEGQHLLAGAAMELWRKADFNGEEVVVDALVRRRAAEKAHYLTPPEGFRPAPSPVLRPTFDHSVIEAAAQAQAARHATVVDVPLDGEAAIAVVEQSSEAHREVASLDAAPSIVAPVGIAFEPVSVQAESPASVLAPSVASDTAPSGFRGFEPPPRRFERVDANIENSPLQAANEVHAALEPPSAIQPLFPVTPIVEPQTAMTPAPAAASPAFNGSPSKASDQAHDPREANLFEQPLAPPSPATPLQAIRSMRLAADGDEVMAPETSPKVLFANGAEPSQASGLLRNRVILYASVGILGVFLFSIAVGNMAFGKASSATLSTLFMGISGIVLMTPAGVWFLMRRLSTPHDAHA